MAEQPTNNTNLKVVYRPKGITEDITLSHKLDFEEAKKVKHDQQIGLGMAGIKEVKVQIKPDDK
jgi:hypothetical protein